MATNLELPDARMYSVLVYWSAMSEGMDDIGIVVEREYV
jgi:hypothetical protein